MKIVKILKPGDMNVNFFLIWEVTDDGYGIAYQEFASDLSDISVREGDTVSTGDKIGVSRKGETGINDTHLHWVNHSRMMERGWTHWKQ